MPPALFARVTDRWWTYEELIEMIDQAETDRKSARPEEGRD
jgi:hypothetical protein